MGLCIFYSGKFKDAASLPLLVEEVKDIAVINKWNYHVYVYNHQCFQIFE